MTDMRRTLLWVVFTMSLVLLWDAWNRHTGQPTMFGSPTRSAATPASGPAGTAPAAPSAAAVPAPATMGAVPAATAPAGAVPTAATPPGSELVTVTTDRVKASFGTIPVTGGDSKYYFDAGGASFLFDFKVAGANARFDYEDSIGSNTVC